MLVPSGSEIYSLFDLNLEISWQSKKIKSDIDVLLSLFPFSKLSTATEIPDIQLLITQSKDSMQIPGVESESRQAYGLSIINNKEVCHVSDGHSLFSTHLPVGKCQISLHHSFSEQSLLSKSNFFLIGMFQLLLGRGFFDLHAAGLVHDGIGFLLIGESGSGKSTTALNLVCNGWHYLSDDALLVCRKQEGVKALGFRKQFYLDTNAAQHWPKVANKLKVSISPENPKKFVDLEQVYPGSLQDSVLPRVMIFNRIVPQDKTVLNPIDQTTALTRLMNQSASLSFNRQTVKQHLALLRDLVKQTRSYELLAGRDMYDDPSKASEVLLSIDLPSKETVAYHQLASATAP